MDDYLSKIAERIARLAIDSSGRDGDEYNEAAVAIKPVLEPLVTVLDQIRHEAELSGDAYINLADQALRTAAGETSDE